MLLNIAFWNVHGLSDHKLDDEYFSSLSRKYEVVCLVEIILKDSSKNLQGYSPPYIVKSTKTKKKRKTLRGDAYIH